MATQFYWQQVEVLSTGYVAQNADLNAPNFVPFSCSEYSDNSEGDDSGLTLVFAIGTFDQVTLEKWINDALQVVVTCSKGDPVGAQLDTRWKFQGQVTDASLTLNNIVLTIGSPLRPATNNEAPGMVPPRSLMSDIAGRLPIARR
jgi:hypothetical protein